MQMFRLKRICHIQFRLLVIGEVRQVFLNILMNSIDALESMKEERKIIIDVFEEDQSIRIVIKIMGQ